MARSGGTASVTDGSVWLDALDLVERAPADCGAGAELVACRRSARPSARAWKPRLASGPSELTVTVDPETAVTAATTEPFSRDHLKVAWAALTAGMDLDPVQLVLDALVPGGRDGPAAAVRRRAAGAGAHGPGAYRGAAGGYICWQHGVTRDPRCRGSRRWDGHQVGDHAPYRLQPRRGVGLAERRLAQARVVQGGHEPLPHLEPDLDDRRPGRRAQLGEQGRGTPGRGTSVRGRSIRYGWAS